MAGTGTNPNNKNTPPPNITQAEVVKYTPPPPSPDRPAVGGNTPMAPISHAYHGEQADQGAQAPENPYQQESE